MHLRLTIVVSRTHWHCVSCRVAKQHSVSIDEHLKTEHGDLLFPKGKGIAPYNSYLSYSDGEVDYMHDCNEDHSDGEVDYMHDCRGKDHKSTCTANVPEDVPCAENVHRPRKRGRPKGSKNKIKPTGPNNKNGSSDGENRVTDLQSDSAVSEQPHNISSTSMTQTRNRLIHEDHNDHVRSRVSLKMDNKSSKTNQNQAEAAISYCFRKRKKQSPDVSNDECDDNEDIDCDESADFECPASTKKSGKHSKSTVKQTQFTDLESVSTTKSDLKVTKQGRGGKPVERNLEIADKEKEKLKNCYVRVRLNKRTEKDLNCSHFLDKSLTKSSGTKKLNDSGNSQHILPEGLDDCKEPGAANSPNSSPHIYEVVSSNADKFDQSKDKKDISNRVVVGNVPNFECVTANQNTGVRIIKVENKSSKDEPSACESVSARSEWEMRNTGQNRCELIDVQASQNELTAQRLCLAGVPEATVVGSVDDTPASQLSGQMQSSSHSSQGLSQQDLRDSSNVTGYAQTSGGQQSIQSDTIQTGKNEVSELEEWIITKTVFKFEDTIPTLSITRPKQIFECTICEGKFSSAEDLSNHMSQMSSHSESVCKKCLRLFHSVYRLNLHVFGDHEKRKKPFCFECGEKFQTMEALERHLHQHEFDHEPQLLSMEFHECQICHKDVVSRHNLLHKHYSLKHKRSVCLECFVQSKLTLTGKHDLVKGHRKTHAYFCNMCFQDFPSTIALEAHYKQHSNDKLQEDGSGQVCDKCDQWCPNRAFLLFHSKQHRLQLMAKWRSEKWGQDLACLYCDKVLRNKRNLQRHVDKAHSSSSTYKFHCEFCGKGSDTQRDLQDHIALHHLGIKRYSCQYCPQRFSCRPSLRRHILKDHATDKQYTCQVCNKKFCEKFSLDKHMYAHTGSARFMCEQCGKGFYFSSDFKKHTATVHVEKGLFSCQVCGQGYKTKEHLKRHLVKCAKAANMDM